MLLRLPCGCLFLALLCAVVACQPPPTAVRTDLAAYLERTQKWAATEAETARTIERILRTEFVNEAEVRHQIADSRPRLLAHLERIRAYSPHVAVLNRIHEHYVTAWQRLLEGFDAIEAGFTSGEHAKLARGRDAMAQWRETLIGVAADLRELQERVGADVGGAVES